MARRIAIVTDSTSRIPPELAAEHEISVVPVEVIVNGLPYSEGVDIGPAAIASALRAGDDVGTSRPSPAQFAATYQALADVGAAEIVSAHLSADLSGTFQSAVLGKTHSPVPVRVLDTRSISMGLGYAVLAGAAAIESGHSCAEVESVILGRAQASSVFLYVDTLEYLRRGGRVGAASAWMAEALRVKPLLTVNNGRVAPLGKARTASKALGRLAEIVGECAAGRDVDICVQDMDTPTRGQQVADAIKRAAPGANVSRGNVGAVVGCHVGPGAIVAVVAPRSW